ncbi:uncharacterized protein LOC123565012 isoform X2 [Mercenaria mercenaria]|uniref:uncharacterized protein LOC123565012 isoform X2 n=1 Tax=Mercenaria mercenaria TaxID=6596 RepID=UPI00234EFA17|nr:uncharacterized protein LOC123565012 isoform X2 [Mercenaria mercenaria]
MALCSLKSCKGSVTADTGKVEVRAFQVTAAERKTLQAEWDESGDAIFHRHCWSDLVDAAKKTSAGKNNLSELEVKLVKEAKKTAEFHDSDTFIKDEAKRIAKMLQQAKYPIFFTGAGISTAAGISDFRGKDGKWTVRDKAKEHGAKASKGRRQYSIMELRPTYTHEAIVKLLEMGMFKYVISQNTDGLHRLSGIPPEQISELHGNGFIQKCEKCKTRYDVNRSHRAMTMGEIMKVPPMKCERCHISHRTGRVCPNKACGGYLMNTIINFGDYLESPILDSAEENAKNADIVFCLGSTLMVSPANSLVEMGKKPIRLVICNRILT